MQASEKNQFQELEQRELQRQERKRLENKRRLALKLEGKHGGSSGESSREPTPPIMSSILFPPLDSHERKNRDVKLVQQKQPPPKYPSGPFVHAQSFHDKNKGKEKKETGAIDPYISLTRPKTSQIIESQTSRQKTMIFPKIEIGEGKIEEKEEAEIEVGSVQLPTISEPNGSKEDFPSVRPHIAPIEEQKWREKDLASPSTNGQEPTSRQDKAMPLTKLLGNKEGVESFRQHLQEFNSSAAKNFDLFLNIKSFQEDMDTGGTSNKLRAIAQTLAADSDWTINLSDEIREQVSESLLQTKHDGLSDVHRKEVLSVFAKDLLCSLEREVYPTYVNTSSFRSLFSEENQETTIASTTIDNEAEVKIVDKAASKKRNGGMFSTLARVKGIGAMWRRGANRGQLSPRTVCPQKETLSTEAEFSAQTLVENRIILDIDKIDNSVDSKIHDETVGKESFTDEIYQRVSVPTLSHVTEDGCLRIGGGNLQQETLADSNKFDSDGPNTSAEGISITNAADEQVDSPLHFAVNDTRRASDRNIEMTTHPHSNHQKEMNEDEHRIEAEIKKVEDAQVQLIDSFKKIKSLAKSGVSKRSLLRLPAKIKIVNTNCRYNNSSIPRAWISKSAELGYVYKTYRSLYTEMNKEVERIKISVGKNETMALSKMAESLEQKKKAYKEAIEQSITIAKEQSEAAIDEQVAPKNWPSPAIITGSNVSPPPKEWGMRFKQIFVEYSNRLNIIRMLYLEKKNNAVRKGHAQRDLKRSIGKAKKVHLKKARATLRKKKELALFKGMVDVANTHRLFNFADDIPPEEKYIDFENSFSFFRWKKKKRNFPTDAEAMLRRAERKTAKLKIFQMKQRGLRQIYNSINSGKFASLRVMNVTDISREVREEVLCPQLGAMRGTAAAHNSVIDSPDLWGPPIEEMHEQAKSPARTKLQEEISN